LKIICGKDTYFHLIYNCYERRILQKLDNAERWSGFLGAKHTSGRIKNFANILISFIIKKIHGALAITASAPLLNLNLNYEKLRCKCMGLFDKKQIFLT